MQLLVKYEFLIDRSRTVFQSFINYSLIILHYTLQNKKLVFISLASIFFFKYHTIHKNYSHLQLKLIPLKWRVGVIVHISSIQNYKQLQSNIITYLTNNPNEKLEYLIFFSDKGTSIQIILQKTQYILPPRPRRLRLKLYGLLKMHNINCEVAKFEKKQFKFKKIFFKKNLPNLNTLVNSIMNMNNLESCILISCQVNKKKIDHEMYSRNFQINQINDKKYLLNRKKITISKIEKLYKVEFKLGLDPSNRKHQSSYHSIIESSANNIRFHSFSWLRRNPLIRRVQAIRIMKIPKLPQLLTETTDLKIAPKITSSYAKHIGQVLHNNEPLSPFGINKCDFKRGGIIAGAIGKGKTTLRLYILDFLLSQNIRIIDFDIKGDAPRFKKIGKRGKIIIPKINLTINPFQTPTRFSKIEYAEILQKTLEDTIPNHESLSPPQINLFSQAVKLTVETDGNCRSFFKNILTISYKEKEIVNNYQDSTAQALLNKFGWMQSSMREIFWTEKNSLTDISYQNDSLFFDFSELKQTVSLLLIRFLMNIIMTRIVASMKDIGGYEEQKHLKLVIFIDEAHLLMPLNKEKQLTPLEEIVTTLRYKGISVIAAGVSADLMSQVLLDTGFIAQYQSESTRLSRSLGLSKEQSEIITQLPSYTCLIKTQSVDDKAIHALIDRYPGKQNLPTLYKKQVRYQGVSINKLDDFNLDLYNHLYCQIVSIIPELYNLNYQDQNKLDQMSTDFIDNISQDLLITINSVKYEGMVKFISNHLQAFLYNRNEKLELSQYRNLIIFITIKWILHLLINHAHLSKIKNMRRQLKDIVIIILTSLEKIQMV